MKMVSLFFRNLLFTVLQPGIVAGLVPYLILGENAKNVFDQPLTLYHALGVLIFVGGVVIMLICIISFAVKGQGTLSPADPTRKLVVAGLYQYSRNPMYVGVTMILVGEAIFFRSSSLWIYTFSVFTAFNLFILLVEEPRLRRDFEDDYTNYCKKVKRWF